MSQETRVTPREDRLVALVTGAASGIGAAAARRIADTGARLVLLDRDHSRLQAVHALLPGPGDVVVIPMDVTDEAAWDQATGTVWERFGRLDWVVASAGVTFGAPLTDTSWQEWRRVLAVNLDGVFLTLRATLICAGGAGGRAGLRSRCQGRGRCGRVRGLQGCRVASGQGRGQGKRC
jgi:NAD(P)-dependent dehydrogenase (short-subunit alcohol dehydrogenase family)